MYISKICVYYTSILCAWLTSGLNISFTSKLQKNKLVMIGRNFSKNKNVANDFWLKIAKVLLVFF